MANYANLEAAIQAAIYENNTNDITGAALQTVLLQMVSDMGKSGMLCNGVCDGNTVPPVAPDSNIFYIAPTGTYANFGGLTVADGEWAIFIYNGGWQKQSIPVVTADAVPTTGSTNPVQSGGVADALDTKADIDGYYSTLTAGSAENLIGRGTVPAEYTRRTSGGSADIGSGAAAIEKIHGNTIVWNQLVNNGNFTSITGWAVSGVNQSVSDGVLHLTATATGTAILGNITQSQTYTNGHIYLFVFDAKCGNSATTINILPSGNAGDGNTGYVNYPNWTRATYRWTRAGTGSTLRFRVYNNTDPNTDIDAYLKNIQCFDLTLKFGAGNEPSSASEFEALFPLDYYTQNTGSLLSLTGTGIETNGFNQWDEQITWDKALQAGTGAIVNANGWFISANYIPVFPSTNYCCKIPTGYGTRRVAFYDANHNFITSGGWFAVTSNYEVVTSPANAAYALFEGQGTTYNNDICINLSWSGYRNGEYEAYWDSTLALPITTVTSGGSAVFADGMKSCPVAYDEMTSTKAIKRCDKRAYTAGDESDSTVITDGTNTIYALTTPVEYTLDSEVNLNYRVDDFGTETLLPQNNATPTTAPIIYDVRYAMNAVDTLRNLPKNYISKDSMEHILNAMVTAGVISAYTLTWNATNENYDCTITA